ncbi:hypothetical protein F5B21DRAFT_523262 [Xylaria acuta]|nr:hypothetical protein F5B21DRAFT_523262 [Xylaria acuta]
MTWSLAGISAVDYALITRWNDRVDVFLETCLHNVVERQAELNPNSLAINAWDGQMTYGDLDLFSSRFANYLIEVGIRPQEFVLFLHDKCRWAPVVITAILKAGAICVPLDPSNAKKRLGTVLDDTKARFAITSVSLASVLDEVDIGVIVSNPTLMLDGGHSRPPPLASPSDPAFLMYSSGSTGKPKGIIQEHGSLCFSISHHSRAMGLWPQSRTLQFAAYTFDTSMGDIFGTFMQGAVLCVCSDWDRLNDLAGSIRSLEANYACLTPTVAQQLEPLEVPGLQTLVVGGEAMTATLVDKWASRLDLINVYGITECLIWTFTTEPLRSFSRSIGRPSCGRAWIVDAEDPNKLLPVGAVGELLIEGPNIARGYLNDPEKTAKAFIPPPPWLEKLRSVRMPIEKVYRTGDLARYTDDGAIDFMGRKDTQVKINGQRVELGEIEYRMKQCLPRETQVAALVVPSSLGLRSALVGVICPISRTPHDHYSAGEEESSSAFGELTEQLRQDLSLTLSGSFVPTAFMPVREMPLTVSGKLDRLQLQRDATDWLQQHQKAYTSIQSVASEPSTNSERQLAAMWSDIFGIDQAHINLEHEFVRLGGDSAQAMRLVSMARKLGFGLTVAQVLVHQRLGDMASVMQRLDPEVERVFVSPFELVKDPDAVRVTAARQCNVSETAVQDAYPCTPLQQGLLTLSVAKPGTYMTRKVFDIPSDVSTQRFMASWSLVYRRFDILRTRIIENGDNLVQVVIDEDIPWEKSNDLELYLQRDRARTVSLGERLNRFAIISNEGIHKPIRVVWTSYHCTYDGWSEDLILREINRICIGDKPREHQAFNVFVKHLQQKDDSISAQYWKDQLAGAEAPSFPVRSDPSRVPQAVQSTKRTVKLIPQDSFTASTIVRSALAILSAYYTNTNEALYGAVLSGRNAMVDGIDVVVGPTISTMPIRVNVERKMRVRELLDRVQKQSIDMIPHESFGLQSIRRLGKEVDVSCDFQCLLIIQAAEEDSLDLGPVKIIYQEATDAEQYPLTIDCRLGSGEVFIEALFDSGVLEESGIQRMLVQFDCIVQQLVAANADQRLENIDPVSPEDLALIWKWNAGYPSAVNRCVHEVVEDSCARTPTKQAVCSWDGDFTYEELNALSTRLASRLQELRIGPEVIVPVCFERSKWATVSVLAINKAGGAFVLLNPSQPLDRLRSIVTQTNSPVILSSRECSRLSLQLLPNVLVVEDILKEEPLQNDPHKQKGSTCCRHAPDALMYVVFTSGTTGVPKGIMVENRSFCTYIEYLARMTGAKSSWRGLVSSAYSFDSSLEEMLMPLMIGGTTCMPSQHDISNDLAGAINRMGVHWGVFTPSLARLINPRELKTMTDIYIGGEQMTDEIVETYGSCLRLTNTYGPSECCPTGCVSSTPELYGGHIGRGVACRTWVVDPIDHHRLMPVGCIGELILDGPNVGRGYLHDEEKTKAAFIDHPSWLLAVETSPTSNGEVHYHRRMYKTGDLVRYCSNGTLEYFGRKDQQIKLYGQRIELSEIEHHIKMCLSEAADVVVDVCSRESSSNLQLLVAFLVFKDGRNLTLRDRESSPVANDPRIVALREALSSRLPAYMVPGMYLECSKIPLTNSDKIDRRSLKQLVLDLSEEDYLLATGMTSEKRVPVTDTEIFLQKLWASILNISPDYIGLDDTFSRLGGDSIQAMRLSASARQQGWGLTVAAITRFPSLEQMSRHMIFTDNADIAPPQPFSLLHQETDVTRLLAEASELCGIESALIEDVYPCSHLQAGLMALSLKSPGSYVVNNVFEIPGHVDLSILERACTAVVDKNPILRTRIVHAGETILQVVLKRDFHWNLTSGSTFEWGLGDPLCRFETSLDSQSKRRFLHWTLHHALYDGWSMSLLQRQLEDFYDGRETSETAPYNSFIRYARSIPDEAARDFWSRRLAGPSPVHYPKLPSPSYISHPDRTIQRIVTVEKKFAPDIAMSNFVQAAWAIIASRHTASKSISFGSTLSGRKADVPGIEAITGPTFAAVPTIVRLHDDDTKSALLQRLHSEALDQIPFEQVGLDRISTYTAETNEACGFQTLFVVQPIEDTRPNTFLDVTADRSDIDTYPVNLECQLTATGLLMKMRFDSAVVSEFQAIHLLSQFSHVMMQLCSPEEMHIRDIISLSPEDMAQIRMWNSTTLDPVDACLHDLILEKCDQSPGAQAVCAWDGDLTYRELKDCAYSIGLRLQKQGARSGQTIPILFDKSRWAIAAMLGVLISGAACVCLDPVNHPIARMKAILQSTNASIIVCDSRLRDTAATLAEEVVVIGSHTISNLETPSGDIANLLVRTAKPQDAAFLIFTSGSTGTPKGIVHSHRSLSSSYRALGAGIKIDSNSRAYQFSAFTFDMCVIDTFATLVNGGCVCVPSDEERINDVEGSFVRLGANEAFFTPSFARQLNPARLTGLRTLRMGGEAISRRDVELWAPYTEVLTISGPAEVSLCTSGVLKPDGHMPPDAGFMINGLSWIADVDDVTRLAPIGVVGELLVEGPTLAREYLDQPEMTRRAFVEVPDWLSVDASQHRRHVYKTGDLVRYNADGSLQLLGRSDGQVKIRGQRVELDEVEHHLIQSLASLASPTKIFGTAVDIVRPKDDPEKPYIVAFLGMGPGMAEDTSNGSFDELTSAILGTLQNRLPPYMVPSAVVPLEEIPMTASNKLDRKTLRALGSCKSTNELLQQTSVRRGIRSPPVTPMEKLVQRLWSTVLKTEEDVISADDTFVQLGGDSIRAIAFVMAAREQKVSITVADVFRKPQLRELAKAMRVQDTPPQDQPSAHGDTAFGAIDADLLARVVENIPQLAGAECVRLSKCTPGQQAILDARSSNIEIFQPHMTFTATSGDQEIDVGRFMRAWEKAVAQHEILRTVLISLPGDASWYQFVLKHYPHPEICYITGEDRMGYTQSRDLLEQRHLPAHQMLIRRENDHLTCTLHLSHALIDGGCVDELFDCLKRHYSDPDAAPKLSPTPQYYHFQHYLQTRPTDNSMWFWSNYLRDARPCLFPSNGKSDNNVLRNFCSRTISLPATLDLRSACLAAGITPPVLIQSAWALTLRRLTCSNDVILGYVVSNREIDSIRRVIGPAFGVVPRRLNISESEDLTEVVRKCHGDWINCMPHQHLSFWEYHQRTHGSSPHQALFHTAINYRRFGRPESNETHKNSPSLILGDVESRDPYEYDILLGIDNDVDDSDGEGMTAKLDYWSSVISEERVTELINIFEGLLQEFVKE